MPTQKNTTRRHRDLAEPSAVELCEMMRPITMRAVLTRTAAFTGLNTGELATLT